MYDLYPKQRAEGEVLLDGENILDPRQDSNLLRARIGMVFQKPTPFPMSIYDNIAFGIRLYEDLPKSEMDGRVETALRGAALWDEVKDKLNASGLSLSGGQQQRLCIARSVAVKPEVILFDEPCSALDPISTAKVEELIDELKAQYTIAIVTHNMQQAARVSDYTAFMYLGELVEFDETSGSSPRPATGARRTTSRAASAEQASGAGPDDPRTDPEDHDRPHRRRLRRRPEGPQAHDRRDGRHRGEDAERRHRRAASGRTSSWRSRSSPATPGSTSSSARSRRKPSSPSPAASRWRSTCATSWRRSASPTTSSASATS